MIPLAPERVSEAIAASALDPVSQEKAQRLAAYGNLLIKWNAHTNLTSISDAEGILQRHIVESVAAAQALPAHVASLLDYGSGAGLPGIPIGICRPDLSVTLAESQAKKVAFLREAVRTAGLTSEVFAGRVADLPTTRLFGVVTMRAVDKMGQALQDAVLRVEQGGLLGLFVTTETEGRFLSRLTELRVGFELIRRHPLPSVGSLLLIRVGSVPRGTTGV